MTDLNGTRSIFNLFTCEEFESEVANGYVRVRSDPAGSMWIANYSQKAVVESHWNEVTENCRGLIYDGDFNLVARSWRKFFNYSQAEAGDLDMSAPVEVTDKRDGSLGIIHLDSAGNVRVASRGSFESDQAIWATKWINENWPFVRDKHDPTLYWALKNFTYLVEIIYPSNRIVCDYGDYEGLVLLGSVDIKHGFYFSPIESAFELWSGDVTEVFPFTTLKEALEAPPRNGAEGLCVRFLKEAKIVKIKQEDYVRLHKIVTGLSEKSVWEHMLKGGTLPDLLAPLPDELHDWARRVYLDLQADIYSIKQGVEAVFRQVKERLPEDAQRSAFAEEFKRAPSITSLLFMRLDNKDLTPAILKMLKPRGDSKAKTFSEETA